MTDLSIMISVARAVVEKRTLPPMPVEALTMALARTVLFLAERPAKELKLAPTESEMAKIREKDPA